MLNSCREKSIQKTKCVKRITHMYYLCASWSAWHWLYLQVIQIGFVIFSKWPLFFELQDCLMFICSAVRLSRSPHSAPLRNQLISIGLQVHSAPCTLCSPTHSHDLFTPMSSWSSVSCKAAYWPWASVLSPQQFLPASCMFSMFILKKKKLV